MRNLNAFGARTHHGQTRIHKTHHDLDLGEASTFPLIVYFMPGHRTSTQMAFWFKSPEIPKVGILATLEAHNFVCRLQIKMKSKEKL
jgi:hypothetical protein